MWKCQFVLDKEGLWQGLLSFPAQSGELLKEELLDLKMYSTENTPHTPFTESAWQKYEKEIKDVSVQHSQWVLALHLKVLYRRVRLYLQRSTKTSFCVWQAGCEKRLWGRLTDTEIHRILEYCLTFLPQISQTRTANYKFNLYIIDFCEFLTDLCVCQHSCWIGHSFSSCVCTTRYWRPWG